MLLFIYHCNNCQNNQHHRHQQQRQPHFSGFCFFFFCFSLGVTPFLRLGILSTVFFFPFFYLKHTHHCFLLSLSKFSFIFRVYFQICLPNNPLYGYLSSLSSISNYFFQGFLYFVTHLCHRTEILQVQFEWFIILLGHWCKSVSKMQISKISMRFDDFRIFESLIHHFWKVPLNILKQKSWLPLAVWKYQLLIVVLVITQAWLDNLFHP